MPKKQSTERPFSSQRKEFLVRYRRASNREELRLLQAYRGLPAALQEHLLKFGSSLVVDRDATVAAARIVRAADPVLWAAWQDAWQDAEARTAEKVGAR